MHDVVALGRTQTVPQDPQAVGVASDVSHPLAPDPSQSA
jgi:hypothetical protein